METKTLARFALKRLCATNFRALIDYMFFLAINYYYLLNLQINYKIE